MRGIQYHRYGGPELMRLEEVERAAPGTGQVLVRVRAAAANPMYWKIRIGDTKLMTGRRFPRGLGYDLAGIVVGVGEAVTRFEVGDEVLGAMSLRASGAFADQTPACSWRPHQGVRAGRIEARSGPMTEFWHPGAPRARAEDRRGER